MKYEGASGHFAPARVNETLTLDFNDAKHFDVHHYAFHVSDEEFDAILRRVQEAEIAFGAIHGGGKADSITGMAAEACILRIRTDTFWS